MCMCVWRIYLLLLYNGAAWRIAKVKFQLGFFLYDLNTEEKRLKKKASSHFVCASFAVLCAEI